MRVAVVGSRNIVVTDIEKYIGECEEIVSGGAMGVDSCAAEYAENANITFTEILPDYKRYGRAAPIIRNKEIVDYADRVVAFWDGKSKGTQSVIEYAEKVGKPCTVILCESSTSPIKKRRPSEKGQRF